MDTDATPSGHGAVLVWTRKERELALPGFCGMAHTRDHESAQTHEPGKYTGSVPTNIQKPGSAFFLDRINRIYRILDSGSFAHIAQNPDNPVNPVEKQAVWSRPRRRDGVIAPYRCGQNAQDARITSPIPFKPYWFVVARMRHFIFAPL